MGKDISLKKVFSKNIIDIKYSTYDYIIIGAGAYGVSFLYRVLAKNKDAKILVLEKGDFLLSEHFQNQKKCYFPIFEKSFYSPWSFQSHQRYDYFGQRPYVGGRALFWNAWTPQPQTFRLWNEEVVEDLDNYWNLAKDYLGVAKISSFYPEFTKLSEDLADKIKSNNKLTNLLDRIPNDSNLEGEFAIRAKDGEWCRFSPVDTLINLIENYPNTIDLLCNIEALSVNNIENKNKKLEAASIDTTQGKIYINSAKLIVGSGVFEPFALVKNSFPNNTLMGKNLLGHYRSQILARRIRSDDGEKKFQLGALYLPGTLKPTSQKSEHSSTAREFHIHVSVVSNPNPEKDNAKLYKMMPDPMIFNQCQDEKYEYFLLQGMSEYLGDYELGLQKNLNYLQLKYNTYSDQDSDKINTVININLTKDEIEVWNKMDQVMWDILDIIGDDHNNLTFYSTKKNTWSDEKLNAQDIKGNHLMHEAGAFWMGDSSRSSVTNLYGKVHESTNLYILGGALFPTAGSWNPTLTGVALTFRLADYLVSKK